MDINITKGSTNTLERVVEKKHSAVEFKSGMVDVLATPAMIAFMEEASLLIVDPALPEGSATVGVSVNISHTAATPVGMKVKIVSELAEIEGKKLTFRVQAWDEKEEIGSGTHSRYIIDKEKFSERLKKKSGT